MQKQREQEKQKQEEENKSKRSSSKRTHIFAGLARRAAGAEARHATARLALPAGCQQKDGRKIECKNTETQNRSKCRERLDQTLMINQMLSIIVCVSCLCLIAMLIYTAVIANIT